MRNVTVSLDDELVRRAKVEAAKRDMSLSRFVASVLEEELCHNEDSYDRARRDFFADPDEMASYEGGTRPSREELYDRPVLRRH